MDYGNIMDVETSGASVQTAQQDNLGYSGVRASETMAQTDAGRMSRYRDMIKRVGKRYGIHPALIAAIISRESRAGNALHDGWGDYDTRRGAYNAWGLMQVDVNPNGGGHTPQGAWNSEEHLCQGTEILVYFIKRISSKFPGWSQEEKLKGQIFWMPYFATEWALLLQSADLRAAAAPGVPQDLRVLSQVSQPHGGFVRISWAHRRPGPLRWCVKYSKDVSQDPIFFSSWLNGTRFDPVLGLLAAVRRWCSPPRFTKKERGIAQTEERSAL